MARSQYVESPRSSRRRKNPPPAPEVDWARAQDELQDSPPHRSWTDRNSDDDVRRERERDRDWVRDRYRETRQDDQAIIMRAPDSRASSSSLRPFHSKSRGRLSTPSRSISSKTSMRVHHPPMSSMTRPSTSKELYRRPSISFREAASGGYDDEDSPPETRRSQSRPRSLHPVSSAPVSRHTSGTFATPYASESENDGEDTETTYDSPDEEREPRQAETERLRSRVDRSRSRFDRSRSRVDRSRSRVEPRRAHHRRPRDEEEYDETDSRHAPSIDEEPLPRPISRSRSRSRAPSARRITQEPQGSLSDEPSVENLRDRFEPREIRKHWDKSYGREPRRIRSDSHADPSPAPKRYVLSSIFGGSHPGSSHRVRSSSKRYYDTEVVSVEKPGRHFPPSASLKRANTVSGSQMAASQHQSVSSTKRSSSSTFLGNFFGPSLHSHHHQAPDKPLKKIECVVCMDDLPVRKAARLKCGHRMCHSCLKRSFKLSITDPQHMPPRCCTADNIPLKHVDKLFDKEFKKIWNKKFTESSAKHRIYCIKRGCNEFIRPEDIHHSDDGRKFGRCTRCRTKVCVKCNGKWHSGRDCPKDEETVRFLAQAKDEGWQRCFRCKAVVELKEGCNHMTCRCGAQFCMICGSRWKSCECPWFNYNTVEEDRLQHMQVPLPARERFGGGRPTVDLPPSPPRDWQAPGPPQYTGPRPRAQNYDEERLLRRLQEGRDEVYARRPQNYHDYDEDREDDFLGGFGDINGLGNAGGHHMNEDFRPRPRHITAPPPPVPPAPIPPMTTDPGPMFDRTGTGYVQDVNRARGVGPNSQERRLADRFNSDLRQSPSHRGPSSHGAAPPPPLQSAATISLPPVMTPALGPASAPTRRHTVEPGEIYADESMRARSGGTRSGGTRSVERVTASGRTTRPVVFEEPEEMALPMGGAVVRKQHFRDPPRASNLAGLTGSGRGMDRVFEWRTHVEPGAGPEMASVSSF